MLPWTHCGLTLTFPVPSHQVLDMEELTIWEQHTATLCKVKTPPLSVACVPARSVAWPHPAQQEGRTFNPVGCQSPRRFSSLLRTPAGALALQSLVAETGPVAPWLCPMWCPEGQLRAGYSEYQDSPVWQGEGTSGRDLCGPKLGGWRVPGAFQLCQHRAWSWQPDGVVHAALTLPEAFPGPALWLSGPTWSRCHGAPGHSWNEKSWKTFWPVGRRRGVLSLETGGYWELCRENGSGT